MVSTFVERWQPETNTFHMLFGEMTITLDDVSTILGIPVTGKSVLVEQLSFERSKTLVEHGLGALHRVVEAPHRGLALADHGHDPHHGAGEQGDADGGDGQTQEDGE